MSDNKKYYYMKLKENFFDSDEMIILETMPDGYLYSNILLKLYLRSLKDNGCLMFKGVIPYTPDVLSKVLRHNVGVVEKAIQVFKQLGLVEILDNGAIYMLDIQNFIGKSSTEADRIRDYRKKVDEQKLISGTNDVTNDVQMYDKSTPELEIEKEIEREYAHSDFDRVKIAYENIHSVPEMPYSNSLILTNLLKDGFTVETIIGIMKEKYKPSVTTLKFYEAAIRETAESASSGRSKGQRTYYESHSEYEAQQAARMAELRKHDQPVKYDSLI